VGADTGKSLTKEDVVKLLAQLETFRISSSFSQPCRRTAVSLLLVEVLVNFSLPKVIKEGLHRIQGTVLMIYF
jgi:hypothetical protein